MSTSNPSANLSTIIFKCDQHAENISTKLQKFYKDKDFFDIILITGNDFIEIPAHKIVLSALSDYFWEIFHGIPKTPSSMLSEVKIKEIESPTINLILDYMYSGSIELNLENIELILRGAVFLKMKNLIGGCCNYIEKNLNHINCLYWQRLAKELTLSGLQEKSLNFIYTHFEEVIKQSEFLLLTKDELKDLLFIDNNRGEFEEKVFVSLVNWIEYQKSNRLEHLFELLSMIRYQFLTPKFIVENSTAISKTVENCELILQWLKYHLSPESRTIDQHNLIVVSDSKPKKENKIREDISKHSVIHINSMNEVEKKRFNETLNKWSPEKRYPLSRNNRFASTIMIHGQFYTVGGRKLNNGFTALNTVECIDLKAFKLTGLPPMRVARYKSQLANLNGHLCVFGGFKDYKESQLINSAEIFNFSTQKWSDLVLICKISGKSRIVGHNGILYIFDFYYGYIQCYDITSNQWTTKELTIDDAINDYKIVATDNFMYFITAYCERNIMIKRFDLLNGEWCDVAELQDRRSYPIIEMATIVENQILFYVNAIGLVEYNLHTQKFKTVKLSHCNNFWILPSK